VLAKRGQAMPPQQRPEWAARGYSRLFFDSVLQADEGCDFDFMTRPKGPDSHS
jgi:dihydroxy-acid dehydratase